MRQCLSDMHVNATCYVGFEANPNFNARLLDVEEALLSSGKRVKIFRETAVSTEDGTIEFLVDTEGHGLGSSAEPSKAVVTRSKDGQWSTDFSRSIKDTYQKVLVPSVDLGRFLHTATQRSPFVAVKLDIEGLEHFRRADLPPETSRGDAAAATWIVRGDESRRRRGRDAETSRAPQVQAPSAHAAVLSSCALQVQAAGDRVARANDARRARKRAEADVCPDGRTVRRARVAVGMR